MKSNWKSVLGGCVIGVTLAGGISVGARSYMTVRAVYVYDVGNAVEVAADGLEGQGLEVFQIANSGYYPTGERRVAIWVKGYGINLTPPVLELPQAPQQATNCPGYPNAPFPGAICNPNGNGGWIPGGE